MPRLPPLPRPRLFRIVRAEKPRALGQGKGRLFLGTAANFDYSSLPWEETVRKNAHKPSSPVTRVIIWTMLLTGPIVGYVFRDELTQIAHHLMVRVMGAPAATVASQTARPPLTPPLTIAPSIPTRMAPSPVPTARVVTQAVPTPPAVPVAQPVASPVASPVAQRAGPPMPAVQTPNERSGAEVVSVRGRDGHFTLDTVVNGVPMPMMFDTGASGVMLRAEDAARFGTDPSNLTYSIRIETANGVSYAAPFTINTLTIGGITVHNVAAIVAKRGTLAVNLLGQSFMTRLAGFAVEGNKMILRGR